jgi:hypothetical protein
MFARRYRKIGRPGGCGSTLVVFDARSLSSTVSRLERTEHFEASVRADR